MRFLFYFFTFNNNCCLQNNINNKNATKELVLKMLSHLYVLFFIIYGLITVIQVIQVICTNMPICKAHSKKIDVHIRRELFSIIFSHKIYNRGKSLILFAAFNVLMTSL